MKLFMKNDGVVSVFLILILVPVLLVTSLFIDASRVQLAQAEASSIGNLAANTLLSQYDTELNDKYGLIASVQDIEDFYVQVEKYYDYAMSPEGSDFLRLLRGEGTNVEISAVENANLANPAMVKKSIIEFMRFRGPMDDVNELYDQINQMLEVSYQANHLLNMYMYKELYYEAITREKIMAYDFYNAWTLYDEAVDDYYEMYNESGTWSNWRLKNWAFVIFGHHYNFNWRWQKGVDASGNATFYTYEEIRQAVEDYIESFQLAYDSLDEMEEGADQLIALAEKYEYFSKEYFNQHGRYYERGRSFLYRWESAAGKCESVGLKEIAKENYEEIKLEKNEIKGWSHYISYYYSLDFYKKIKEHIGQIRSYMESYQFCGTRLVDIKNADDFENVLTAGYSVEEIASSNIYQLWDNRTTFSGGEGVTSPIKVHSTLMEDLSTYVENNFDDVDVEELEIAKARYETIVNQHSDILDGLLANCKSRGELGSILLNNKLSSSSGVDGSINVLHALYSTDSNAGKCYGLCNNKYQAIDDDFYKLGVGSGECVHEELSGEKLASLYVVDYISKMFSYDTFELDASESNGMSLTENTISAQSNDSYLSEIEYILYGDYMDYHGNRTNTPSIKAYQILLLECIAMQLLEYEESKTGLSDYRAEGNTLEEQSDGIISENAVVLESILNQVATNTVEPFTTLYNGGKITLPNGQEMSYLNFLQMMMFLKITGSGSALRSVYSLSWNSSYSMNTFYIRTAEVIQANMTKQTGKTYNMKNAKLYYRVSSKLEVSPMMLALDIFGDATDPMLESTSWRTFNYETIRGY